ncbi:MAG: hypothetical protein H6739_11095 [Alphaproteobacteria bacterium]|nr:hypothetical protein [Alphaproteobacteria bacterium]
MVSIGIVLAGAAVALILIVAVVLGMSLGKAKGQIGDPQAAELGAALGFTQANPRLAQIPPWYTGDVDGRPAAVTVVSVRAGAGTYSRHETSLVCRVVIPVEADLPTVAYRRPSEGDDPFLAAFTGQSLEAVPPDARSAMVQFVDTHGYLWLSPRPKAAQLELSKKVLPDAGMVLLTSFDAEGADADRVRQAVGALDEVARTLESR